MKNRFKFLSVTLALIIAMQSLSMSRLSRVESLRARATMITRSLVKPGASRLLTQTTAMLVSKNAQPFRSSIAASNNKQEQNNQNNYSALPQDSKVKIGLAGLAGLGTIVLTEKEFEEFEAKRGSGRTFSKNAVIENGLIKGATHYSLIPAGKTETHSAAFVSEPIVVQHSPSANFWGYDLELKIDIFLGKIRISNFDKETLESMDKLIDPQAKLPVIAKAVIADCIKRGRHVRFFDDKGNLITSANYHGTIDIKSAKNSLNLRPYSLLKDLKEVEESKPPFWLFRLFGARNTIERLKYE